MVGVEYDNDLVMLTSLPSWLGIQLTIVKQHKKKKTWPDMFFLFFFLCLALYYLSSSYTHTHTVSLFIFPSPLVPFLLDDILFFFSFPLLNKKTKWLVCSSPYFFFSFTFYGLIYFCILFRKIVLFWGGGGAVTVDSRNFLFFFRSFVRCVTESSSFSLPCFKKWKASSFFFLVYYLCDVYLRDWQTRTEKKNKIK